MSFIRNTPCGAIQGVAGRVKGTVAYKGIRYATAGRWEYPKIVTHWEGVYDATQYGKCSYQPRAFYDEAAVPEKAFYYHEFREGEHYEYSEDCLFLNVFTPEKQEEGKACPVIVYIHGGGYVGGCGHEKHFDGPVWPAKGVIAVTLNYRLGPLGFMCLPELEQEAGHTGNYGLFDQLTAIHWVRENIAAFGGDPEKITIMGQSAGAMSVQQLVLSPLTQGLVHRAVTSSGGGVSSMMTPKTPKEYFPFWRSVMAQAGCENLEQFRKIPPERLFDAWQRAKKQEKGGAMAVSPVLDGILMVGKGSDLAKKQEFLQIPYLAGSTSEDMMPPMIYTMGRNWCAIQKKPSFSWFFHRHLPGDDCGAWHSSDLWYWFGTLDNCWRPMEEQDRLLSEEMSGYLCNFAKMGDPNGPGLPVWEPTQKRKRSLRLGDGETQMGKASMVKLIRTMLTNKAVGE